MRELRVVDASELASAYASAHYGVAMDGDTVRLRVGQAASDLEAYWPAERYVFLTAWNPASEPHSDTANETADALLVAQLDATGAQRLAAWSEAPDGGWHEPGWLLADLDEITTQLLAREFGQAAVLSWERGEPVRLRMLLERPDCSDGAEAFAAFTDWVDDIVAA